MGGEEDARRRLPPVSLDWAQPRPTAGRDQRGPDGEAREGFEGSEDDGRTETPAERLDRNLDELTGELRVVVTGVQVLFAFLLIVPFNVGFEHVGDFERIVYFVTLVLAACAALCTLAPSAQHRFLFRQGDKRHIVFSSNRVAVAGLVFLALAMCGCLLLVTTKLFGATAGVLATCVAAIPFAVLWFAAPIYRASRLERRPGTPRTSPLRERASSATSGPSAPQGRLRRRA
ncbi:MAG TPA: DUF6328 family protein [Solirubrobacteraceae bacterium]|nr:DUF6328 family protein [Solirubrobacteraceae bacterium]